MYTKIRVSIASAFFTHMHADTHNRFTWVYATKIMHIISLLSKTVITYIKQFQQIILQHFFA